MLNQFVFRGISDAGVETSANQRLARILEGAPFDSSASALVERVGESYFASVDVHSTHGPFQARASGKTPTEAVDRVLSKISQLLANWRALRFSQRDAIVSPFIDMGRA